MQGKIDQLRAQQKKDSEELPSLNKVLAGINARIDKVKLNHTKIDNDKASFTSQLEGIDNKRSKIRE